MVFDTIKVWLVRVLNVQVSVVQNSVRCNTKYHLQKGNLRLPSQWVIGTASQLPVDGANLLGDVRKRLVEEI